MGVTAKIVETASGAETPDASKAFWVKCGDCGHCWPAAYFPQDAAKFARAIGRKPRCPKCASINVLVAKQNDGVLLEPSND